MTMSCTPIRWATITWSSCCFRRRKAFHGWLMWFRNSSSLVELIRIQSERFTRLEGYVAPFLCTDVILTRNRIRLLLWGCCKYWMDITNSCFIHALLFRVPMTSILQLAISKYFVTTPRARKQTSTSCEPLGLRPVHFFIQHILHYVSSHYEKYSVARVWKFVP